MRATKGAATRELPSGRLPSLCVTSRVSQLLWAN